MFFGTDLAMERREITGELPGLTHREYRVGDASVSVIEIQTEEAARKTGKACGKYTTVSVPSMQSSPGLFEGRVTAVADCLGEMLPTDGAVLIAGLGNTEITSDAFGPKCAEKIFATAHIKPSLARELGFEKLRKVYAVTPGVTGKTGLEACDTVKSICAGLDIAAVIAVDAIAARDISRVGTTIQITDAGLAPGSGVNNARKELSRETIGIPVIAIGVPTVINILHAASSLFREELTPERIERSDSKYRSAVVTVREADSMVERAAALTAMAINKSLQPSLTKEELTELCAP